MESIREATNQVNTELDNALKSLCVVKFGKEVGSQKFDDLMKCPSDGARTSSETDENMECDQLDENGDANQNSPASGGSETESESSGDANQNSPGSGGSETESESSNEEVEGADEGKGKSFRIYAKNTLRNHYHIDVESTGKVIIHDKDLTNHLFKPEHKLRNMRKWAANFTPEYWNITRDASRSPERRVKLESRRPTSVTPQSETSSEMLRKLRKSARDGNKCDW